MDRLLLIGDSQLLRFNNYCNSLPAKSQSFQIHSDSLMISGYTTACLKNAIKQLPPTTKTDFGQPECILLFTGTNDIVNGTPINHLKDQYTALLRTVNKTYSPKQLFILALPNYPKFDPFSEQMRSVDDFNRFLATLQTNKVRRIRLQFPPHKLNDFFEQRYHPSGRIDRLHLNKQAFFQLTNLLAHEINKSRTQNTL